VKTFAAGLAAHYALARTTLATFFSLERRDGQILYFTGSDVDIVYDGHTWISARGLDQTKVTWTSGAAVNSLQLTILPDDDIPENDLIAGLWDFARFFLFEANYLDPAGGINPLLRGWTGQVDATNTGYTLELRGLKQAWQQPLGAVTQKTCRSRLGDAGCTIDLTGSPANYTRTYLVSAVASRHVFTCSAATEVADWYGNGTAEFLTGANALFSGKVKEFAAGVFTLSLSMPYTIQVGDSVRVVAGCRQRLLDDCKLKFNNVLNFQGEPHLKGIDLLTADPDVGGS
jgi:uncharacterized phage protein (TIGR02218 family)